jgi:hypothetical protein
MDFVERIFAIAPDGGSGVLELSILLAVAVLVSMRLLLGRAAQSPAVRPVSTRPDGDRQW